MVAINTAPLPTSRTACAVCLATQQPFARSRERSPTWWDVPDLAVADFDSAVVGNPQRAPWPIIAGALPVQHWGTKAVPPRTSTVPGISAMTANDWRKVGHGLRRPGFRSPGAVGLG